MTTRCACLLFGLLIGGCGTSNTSDGMTRAALITGFEHFLKSNDQNGDERLSRAEVRAMVDPGDYAALDVDHDGYLTLAEILRKPLATFTCIDSNGSGSLSASEILERGDHCGPEGVQKAV